MNATNEQKQRPTHRVYYVKKGEGDNKADWLELGAAWPHKDGKGLDVVLEVVPIGVELDRLTLRIIEAKDAAA